MRSTYGEIPGSRRACPFTSTFWRNAWKYRSRTYRHFGWDNGTIVANIWIGFPFNFILLYSGICGIPQEIYEAARIDGASYWITRARIVT